MLAPARVAQEEALDRSSFWDGVEIGDSWFHRLPLRWGKATGIGCWQVLQLGCLTARCRARAWVHSQARPRHVPVQAFLCSFVLNITRCRQVTCVAGPKRTQSPIHDVTTYRPIIANGPPTSHSNGLSPACVFRGRFRTRKVQGPPHFHVMGVLATIPLLLDYSALPDLESPVYTVGKQCSSLRFINHADQKHKKIVLQSIPEVKLRTSSEPTNGSDFAYL